MKKSLGDTVDFWWEKLPQVGSWGMVHKSTEVQMTLDAIAELNNRIRELKHDLAKELNDAERRARLDYSEKEIREAKERSGWRDKQIVHMIASL